MVEYQKSMDDVTKYLYDYTGKRIKKLRTKTGEIVYRLGEYEVNRRPGKTDRHTVYVKGASGDLVAQYTQDGAVLVTDDTLNGETTIWNLLNTQRIEFLKFLVRTQSDYPYAVRLFALSIVFVLILAYFIPMYFYNLKQKEEELYTGLSNPFIRNNRALSFISPFVLISVVFVFGTACVPEGLKGHDKEPFWLMGTFTSPQNGGSDPSSISDPGQPGRPSPGIPEVGMYFFHPNHLGSISMVTDARGKIAAIGDTGATKVSYKPYGEIDRANSAGADIFRHKYTAKEEDSETGFYYYNSRYYDPFIGRFTQADSMIMPESPMGMNQYMYTEGNPVRFTDPSGHTKYEVYMARAKKDFQKAVMEGIASQSDIHAAVTGYYATNQKIDNEKTMDRKFYQHFLKAVAITVLMIVSGLWIGWMTFAGQLLVCTGIGYGIGSGLGFIAGGFSGGTNGIVGGKYNKERALRGAKQGGLIGGIMGASIVISWNLMDKYLYLLTDTQDKISIFVAPGIGVASIQSSITSAGMKDFQGFMLGEINLVHNGKVDSSNELTYRTSLFNQDILFKNTSQPTTGISRCNLPDTQIKSLGMLGGDVFDDESCSEDEGVKKIENINTYDYQKDYYNGFN